VSGAIREDYHAHATQFPRLDAWRRRGAGIGVQPALPQPARKRLIVDSQVHLWKANSPDYPWNPSAQPQLPEPFTIERALPLMDEAGVDRGNGRPRWNGPG
jgi:hypothetical protein